MIVSQRQYSALRIAQQTTGNRASEMDAASLAALPRRKPLSERDQQRLAALCQLDLPITFKALAEWMATHGEKGEQEGFL